MSLLTKSANVVPRTNFANTKVHIARQQKPVVVKLSSLITQSPLLLMPFLPSSPPNTHFLDEGGPNLHYLLHCPSGALSFVQFAWEGAFVCVAAISLWWLCVEVSRTPKRTPLKQQQPAAMFECNVIQFWTIVVGRVSIREFLSHSDPPPKFAHFNL